MLALRAQGGGRVPRAAHLHGGQGCADAQVGARPAGAAPGGRLGGQRAAALPRARRAARGRAPQLLQQLHRGRQRPVSAHSGTAQSAR